MYLFDEEMKLRPNVARSFKPAKVFKESTLPINSVDFSENGRLMVTGSEEEAITIYDLSSATQKKSVNSKKYGADLVRFTNSNDTKVLHASTKLDDTIRYLDLQDNRYIRYFRGHYSKVTSLNVNRKDSRFISCSRDQQARLWELQSPGCTGCVKVGGESNLYNMSPHACFDTQGMAFAVTNSYQLSFTKEIKLYDVRKYDKGPFITFKIPVENEKESRNFGKFTGVEFSPNCGFILATTDTGKIYLLDAFDGYVVRMFDVETGRKYRSGSLYIQACFSPDGQFIYSGDCEGKVHIWQVPSYQDSIEERKTNIMAVPREELTILETGYGRPIRRMKWNTEYMMFASASDRVTMWLPTVSEDL